eukprot:529404-Alexandrium_andersonii.AAC.1
MADPMGGLKRSADACRQPPTHAPTQPTAGHGKDRLLAARRNHKRPNASHEGEHKGGPSQRPA